MTEEVSHRLSVAPMMAVTDRHFRCLFRHLSRRSKLYTEMLVDQTLLHQRDHLWHYLGHGPGEEPLAVQLGGNDPDSLAEAAEMCEQWNFTEINLNCGCPSPKVSGRCFGARLMLDPERVRQIMSCMIRKVSRTPVTVKCRIGVDNNNSYEDLVTFVQAVQSAGVDHIIVHARTCMLNGLSPSANRTIPPLQYDVVHRLAAEFPELTVVINGGITSVGDVNDHLLGRREGGYRGVGGVMVGRAAYNNPWAFRHADSVIFGSQDQGLTRREIVHSYLDCFDTFMEEFVNHRKQLPDGMGKERLSTGLMLKPITFLSSGFKGSRRFRQELNDLVQKTPRLNPDADELRDMVQEALKQLPNTILDEPVGDPPEDPWTGLGT
ncbi:unnamed protein product [Choristocarpus tenellus]